jgi:hypothetical protein
MTGAAWLKPRPTIYKGIQMRSRLEALYAQSLDSGGIEWEYEPQCFADEQGQYLPYFRVNHRWWVEVKPESADLHAALAKMHRILSTETDARLTVSTNEGSYENPSFGHWRVSCCPDFPCGHCHRPNPSHLHVEVDGLREMPTATEDNRRVVALDGAFVCCSNCLSGEVSLTEVKQAMSSGYTTVALNFECRECRWKTELAIDACNTSTWFRVGTKQPPVVDPSAEGDPF